MFSKTQTGKSTGACCRQAEALRQALAAADAVVIGAGAGLSTAAGLVYTGRRLQRYFGDFTARYGFEDMYSGGFYPFPSLEEHWAYWSRYIYINRYQRAPKPVYRQLLALVQDKDYFVLTTNVDHQFQMAGFDKHRLFYTQGDYGLWQCSVPCHNETYDNEDAVRAMLAAQGFAFGEQGALYLPEGTAPEMKIPGELVPRCPRCGKPMAMNLRADATFVEDAGWHAAARRYEDFIRRHSALAVLYLELGVGMNTPGIIKYNFWRQVYANPKARYVCVNPGQAWAPREIAGRSLCIDGDAGELFAPLAPGAA